MNENYRHRHQKDVERLQRVILHNGYHVNLRTAAGIWEEYSEEFAAGWLGMPNSDLELWEIIRDRVESIDIVQ